MNNIYNIQNNSLDIFDLKIETKPNETHQGNYRWHEQRRGKFTGSKIKELMSCGRSTSKIEWGRPEKIIDFGEVAKKYVFSRAKERQSGIVLQRSIGRNGDYGNLVEPIIFKMLQEKYTNLNFENVGFIEFIKGIAGASPDGLIGGVTGLEIKAPMTWETFYSRMETPFDQKHDDFWQIQSEMSALGVNELMYAIADPPENLFEPEIKNVSEKIVYASPIHQNAIKQRCLIGNAAIEMYLDGVNFQEAMRIACTEFEF